MFRHLVALFFIALSSPVLASSIVNLDLTLRIGRIYWYNVEVWDDIEGKTITAFKSYDKGQGNYLLEHPLVGQNVGDLISFTATIVPTDNYLTHFGYTTTCFIDGYNCNTGGYYEQADPTPESFVVGGDNGGLWSIKGDTTKGQKLEYFWVPEYNGGSTYFDNNTVLVDWRNGAADLTVIENNLIPAPLPASLPMLAFGLISASYLVRRR